MGGGPAEGLASVAPAQQSRVSSLGRNHFRAPRNTIENRGRAECPSDRCLRSVPLGLRPPTPPLGATSKKPSSARERPPPRGLFLLPTAALDGPRRYRRRPRSSPMTLPDPTGDAVRFSALRSSAEISVGAANPHRGSSRAKGLRRQACAYSGEVVTKFQSDSSRTDSPVRILYAREPNLTFGQIALSIACRLRRDGGGFCQQIKRLA